MPGPPRRFNAPGPRPARTLGGMVDWLGIVFLLVAGVAAPYLAIRTSKVLAEIEEPPGRGSLLASILLSHGVLLGLGLAAAWSNRLVLFPAPSPAWSDLGWAGGLLLAALVALPVRWRVIGEADKARLRWLLPRGAQDAWWWGALSLVAGIVEEIVFRGVMFGLLDRMLGGWWPAALICIAAFTAGHWVQRRGALVLIALFALGFHGLVAATGDLYAAIAVHAVYDFAAGYVLLGLERRDRRRGQTACAAP